MEVKEIIKLIDADIKYQSNQLTGIFENDKPTQWRITGMKELKKKILKK